MTIRFSGHLWSPDSYIMESFYGTMMQDDYQALIGCLYFCPILHLGSILVNGKLMKTIIIIICISVTTLFVYLFSDVFKSVLISINYLGRSV